MNLTPAMKVHYQLDLREREREVEFLRDAQDFPDEQDLLPVGIWSIEESDEAALDRYEGVSSGLYRKVEINGMLTYRMNQSGIHSPSSYYFDTILNGYRDFSLDTSELYNARDNAHFEDRGGWGYASWM